jgi:ribosomal protein S20
VAHTIGIDRKTLRQDLRSGQTIARIATANGMQPQAVIDALVAYAHHRIDQAVAKGRISTERAARIEQRLPDRVTKIVDEWHPRRFRTSADG